MRSDVRSLWRSRHAETGNVSTNLCPMNHILHRGPSWSVCHVHWNATLTREREQRKRHTGQRPYSMTTATPTTTENKQKSTFKQENNFTKKHLQNNKHPFHTQLWAGRLGFRSQLPQLTNRLLCHKTLFTPATFYWARRTTHPALH